VAVAAIIVVVAGLIWWFFVRTPTGTVQAAYRPNPACKGIDLCVQVAREGRLLIVGPIIPNAGQGDDFFHVYDLTWPTGQISVHLPAGRYKVQFLINTDNGDTALVTTRGQFYTFQVREGSTTNLGVLMPAVHGLSFPAFGD
jgi:hypothetical protein